MSETTKQEAVQRRVVAVARKIVAVQRLLSAFDHGDEQYLSKTVDQAMRECEQAFADKDYARAEHLAKIMSAQAIDRDRCVPASVFVAKPYQHIDILSACQRLRK
jgi:hypothetical protein